MTDKSDWSVYQEPYTRFNDMVEPNKLKNPEVKHEGVWPKKSVIIPKGAICVEITEVFGDEVDLTFYFPQSKNESYEAEMQDYLAAIDERTVILIEWREWRDQQKAAKKEQEERNLLKELIGKYGTP